MKKKTDIEQEKDTHIDIIAYLKVLWRRRLVMGTAIAATLIFTIIYTLLSPKIYEASTSILIQQVPEGQDSFLSPWEFTGARDNFIRNQAQILKSRTNLKQVIEKIKEEHGDKDLPVLNNPGPVNFLVYNIIVKPVERTDIIRVLVHSTSPEESAVIANAVAENLLEQSRVTARRAVSEVRKFLEDQLTIVQDDLKQSADSLMYFKEKNKVFSLSTEAEALFAKLSTFDKQYNEANAEYMTKKRRLDYLREKYQKNQKNMIEDITKTKSPLIINLREQLIEYETRYNNYLLQGLASDHPKMKRINKLIEETKNQLREEVTKMIASGAEGGSLLSLNQSITEEISDLETEIVALQAKKSAIGGIKSKYESQFSRLPSKELQLAQLKRAYQINDNTYKMLMEKYEETKIKEAGQLGSVKIIDKAFVPSVPIKPNKKKNVLFALLVGIGIGLVFTVFTEYLDTSIKDPKDIEETIEEPTLGIIPRLTNRELNEKYSDNGNVSDMRQMLLTYYAPRSNISEAYRSLRTNLQYFNADKPLKSLLITSAIAKEGKSTISSNLGITMSQRGLNTIIIDGDLRKPALHKLLDMDLKKGLTDCIINPEMSIDDIIKKTSIENLSLITAGDTPPNPTDLLESESMKTIIKKIKKRFDFVIVDSPPIMVVSDAVVISRILDGVLIVIESKRTRKDAIYKSKEIIENVGGKVLGVVLNKSHFSRIDRLYGGYSGYYYSYYSYDSKEHKKKVKKRRKGGKE